MSKYLLSHDLGTTGNKATLFTTEGKMLRSTVCGYDTKYYNNGWAEQNPMDWWKAICKSTRELTQDIDTSQVAAIATCGQMMGCLCVDEKGTPLYNHIIWADLRSTEQEKQLWERTGGWDMYRITGHRPSASYTLAKLMWMKKNEPDVYNNTYKVLNAKDYIVFRMTGKFLTDLNDAGGTTAMDIETGDWSGEIIEMAEVDMDRFPTIVPSTHVVGELGREAADECGLPAGIPVVMGAGDGGCSAVGSGMVRPGISYGCFGSSGWIASITEESVLDEDMIIPNWAHTIPGLLMPTGTMQSAGGSYTWMKNQLCLLETHFSNTEGKNVYEQIDAAIQSSPPGANGLVYLPYLQGERVPRWNPNAKGAFIGLTMEHTHADMLRSVVEGVGLNMKVMLDIMQKKIEITELPIVGGLAESDVNMQIFTDILGLEVHVLNHLEEATSIGAAVTAGVGVGEFKSYDEVDKFIWPVRSFEPNMKNHAMYEDFLSVFDDSYYALENVFDKMTDL